MEEYHIYRQERKNIYEHRKAFLQNTQSEKVKTTNIYLYTILYNWSAFKFLLYGKTQDPSAFPAFEGQQPIIKHKRWAKNRKVQISINFNQAK